MTGSSVGNPFRKKAPSKGRGEARKAVKDKLRTEGEQTAPTYKIGQEERKQ